MKKTDWQQAERKMDEGVKSGVSLWDRIMNNPDFRKAKLEIQARYGLPVPYDIRLNNQEWIRWMGQHEKPTSQTAKRGRAFLVEIHALFKKFEVPDAWHYDFIAEIAGNSQGHPLEAWGSPKFEIYKDNEDNLKWRCIITPETDLNNPFYLEMIQNQQKLYAGDPPKPAKDKNNKRKLDWRPVYEWARMHPLFTLEEIADKMGIAPQRLRLKFAELEDDK